MATAYLDADKRDESWQPLTAAEKHILEKEMALSLILKNSVYMEDSGMISDLRRALGKLSVCHLKNLELIVSIKTQDAREGAGA